MQKVLEKSGIRGVIINNQFYTFQKENSPSPRDPKRHLRTRAAEGEICAKAINSLETWTKVQAF